MFTFMKKPAAQNETAAPVAAAEFKNLMAPHAPSGKKIAVAVSGGPDSMALATLLKNWATENHTTLQAFIVDHALRKESAAEALATQKTLEKCGIPAEILRWEHPPIVSRLHITARKARYRLLADACRRHGIAELFFAHQKEDQAETILMRLAKGSGIDGLAGIAAENYFEDIRLLRPLLSISKTRLIATCEAENISYTIDPSNLSEKFARGRLRRILPFLAEEGLTLDRLTDLGSRAADAKAALDYYTQDFLQNFSTRDISGAISFDLENFRTLPKAIKERAITAALRSINPEDYAPEHASLQDLTTSLEQESEFNTRTLHGALITRSDSQITFMREYSAITDTPKIRTGQTLIWDHRWQITLQNSGPPEEIYTLRPLGNPPHETLDHLAPGLRKKIVQGRARSSLPAFYQGDNLVRIPSFSDQETATATLISVWPSRPLGT